MSNFIDIHTHILPGIDDDGPPDLQSSLELARELVRRGFDTVIATPHSFEGDPPAGEILACWLSFVAELKQRKIPLQVLPGAELTVEPGLLQRVQDGRALTLNRGRYLLIELPVFQEPPLYTEGLLFELQAHGYRPILAHPERMRAFQSDSAFLEGLVAKGVYLQLTLGSLTGLMGPAARQTSWRLLSQQLVHFMATDAHSTGRRLSQVDPALEQLERRSAGTATLLRDNPALLLQGKEPRLPEAPLRQSRLRLFRDRLFPLKSEG